MMNIEKKIVLFLPLLVAPNAVKSSEHPNIIYVFPDQYRNAALEFWGTNEYKKYVNFVSDPVHTPNLNAFADQSVILTSAQSNCPISSPHRGMLLTGMYPDGSGVPLNCNSTRPISSLRKDVDCISDVFSRNGYDCAYFGKLHVDFPTPNDPNRKGKYVSDTWPEWDAYTAPEQRHGFNYWYSYGTFDEHKNPHYWDNDGTRHDPKEYSPKHEVDKLIHYLNNERDKSKPFFAMMSMNPPHGPYRSLDDCMEEDYDLYKDIPLEKLLLRPNLNPKVAHKMESAPYYFANVTGVDREFGRILAELKRLGIEDNTIVVFTSDHGETMCSHQEDPKNAPYSEAMNVPFLIRYPAKLKPRVSNMLLSTADIMPTLIGLADLQEEIPNSVQGDNLASSLISAEVEKQMAPEAVLYLRNLDGKKNDQGLVESYFPVARGIKTDKYTLAFTIDRDKNLVSTLFFDDQNDPYQMSNLDLTKYPDVVTELCSKMALLLKRANDPWFRQGILEQLIPYSSDKTI